MKTNFFVLLLLTGFLCAEAQTWTWSEDQLPYACDIISATVMDDSIFISQGRWDDNSFPNIAQIYDIGENQWETVQLQSTPRCFAAAVSANGMVFFAGGITLSNSVSKDDIDVYNKATGEWTFELHLSEARNYLGVTACENKVFFAGGINPAEGAFYNVIDIYDTETGELSIINLTEQKCMVGTAAAGGKVFFAGGSQGTNQATDLVEIYDISTGEWTYDTLSEARALTATVNYGDKVYFAGGAKPNAIGSDVVDIYNVVTGEWDTMTLSSPRVVKALNVMDALIFAGEAEFISLTNGLPYFPNGIIDIYYPETGQWDYAVSQLNPARHFYGCAAYENKAYFAGGGYPDDPMSLINILEYPTVGASNNKFQESSFRVHPNPFTSAIGIDYNLKRPENASFIIYNQLGKKVAEMLDEYRQQGDQQLIFNAEKLTPGIYFCVLKTSEGVQTKKIVKLK